MAQHRFELKSKEEVGEHVEDEVHPVAMNKAAGNKRPHTPPARYAVRMQNHLAVYIIVRESHQR